VLVLGRGCGGGTHDTVCPDPCDLVQSVLLDFSGGVVASVGVSDLCGGGVTCSGNGGCGPIDVYLRNGSAVPAGDGGPELVCHVTATSVTGDTVEVDLTAQYTASRCCSGYQFPSPTRNVSFSPADAAGTDAADGG